MFRLCFNKISALRMSSSKSSPKPEPRAAKKPAATKSASKRTVHEANSSSRKPETSVKSSKSSASQDSTDQTETESIKSGKKLSATKSPIAKRAKKAASLSVEQSSSSEDSDAPPRKSIASLADDFAAERLATASSILQFDFRKKRILSLRPDVAEVRADCKGILYWMSRDCRVQDNWALLYAQKLALKNQVALHVVFSLHSDIFPELTATLRHYHFLLGGLRQVAAECAELNINFHLLSTATSSEAIDSVCSLVQAQRIGCVVCDFWPLRAPRALLEEALAALPDEVAVCQVDAHNVVPVWETSEKLEYAARTIRGKVNGKLDTFLQPFPAVQRHPHGKAANLGGGDGFWEKQLALMECDRSVKEVAWAQPGYAAAVHQLATFCSHRLRLFATKRNDPLAPALSQLAPWLRFGQIAAARCVLTVRRHQREHPASVAAYCEEAIVRRELSENFCYYQPHYDSLDGLSDWARASLRAHAADRREWLYDRAELEAARTHDDLWNSAQLQLRVEGKMHGFMRMYWAKKVLEWMAGPEEALATAIYLNDKYSLDGYSPNGYVGCMWSIGGVHDMGWKERPVFGKIRYMNYAGCKRKFDVAAYVARYGGKVYEKAKGGKGTASTSKGAK